MSTLSNHETVELPLISPGFLYKMTAVIAVLALLTAGISLAGRWFGQRIALAGHTDSTAIVSLDIGEDRIALSENTIRFARQRVDGPAERVDLYLTWPEMRGYETAERDRFDDADRSGDLVFLQITQSTMSRDMSGRLEPIYRHLFADEGHKSPFGLTMHRMRADAGYGDEVFFTATRAGEPDYVVRCLLPKAEERPTSGDCQRDIHVGNDLSVLYRFSSAHLSEWQHIDAEIRWFVEARLSNPA